MKWLLGLGLGLGLGLVVMAAWLEVSSAEEDLREQFLAPQNAARAEVGVGHLQWDDTVASYARSYAAQRRGDCALKHSGSPRYGENIFWGSGGYSAGDAVKASVSEKEFYNYASNTCTPGQQCGHYTQVVWKHTQKVGCARVVCNNGGVFITCNYFPPGNYVGEKPY